MVTGIVPLDAVAPGDVEEFLVSHGLSAEQVRWKYFGRGRARGMVAVEGRRVTGFLGLVPFDVRCAGRRLAGAWTCDWYVDGPGASGPLGIRLVRRAGREIVPLLHLGGNPVTRRIFARLAQRTVAGAGVVVHRALRFGDLVRRGARRIGRRAPDRPPLARLPLRRLPRAARAAEARTADGVAPAIGPLLRRPGDPQGCAPLYDADYVEWQLARCPLVTGFTCWLGEPDEARCAALFWRLRGSRALWRAALLPGSGDPADQAGVLAAGVRRADAEGALGVRALVSRLDPALVAAFRSAGFAEHSRVPLHVLSGQGPETPLDRFHGLSYLDDDLPQIFE